MNKILKDNGLDQILSKQGYVVVPFLNKEKVKDLCRFFQENHTKEIPGFYASAHSPDLAFRQRMNEKIKEIYSDSFDHYFTQCEALGGSFVVKTKIQEERLHPHQDWNIVDESKFRSFNIWVPLIDLNEENGAIRVIPKSHLWFQNFRGPNIPDQMADKSQELWEQMKTLKMKAGEALIYDHRLYHASFPNLTDEYRLATVFGVKPKAASMFYYYGNKGNIDVYESSVDFFMNGNIQNGPKVLKKINTIRKKKAERETSNGWFHSLFNWFSNRS